MKYLHKCSGLVLGLLWLLTADLATAGEEAPSMYKVLMSKQDQLCQIVRDELNERMTVLEPDYAGPLNYDAHPGMASIRWRPMTELESPLKENEGSSEQFHWTRLDFNHDGKEDIVVQHTWNVFGDHEMQSNAFYFFDASYRGLRQTHTRQEFFRSHAQKGFGGGLELQEYWFPEWYPVPYDSLAPLLYLFVFHGDSYLHIVPGRGGGIHVIAHYTRPSIPPPPYDRRKWRIQPAKGNPIGLEELCYVGRNLSGPPVATPTPDGAVPGS